MAELYSIHEYMDTVNVKACGMKIIGVQQDFIPNS
jgi:hypothetical protein